MYTKELLLRLLRADDGESVHRIILDSGLDGPDNWRAYGKIANNAGTFENQQSLPETSMIEKLTNGEDAILIKECLKRGTDPKANTNPDVPHSVKEAIEKYFSIKNGDWKNADPKTRREIAKLIQIIITGNLKYPSITIYDHGIGENPSNF